MKGKSGKRIFSIFLSTVVALFLIGPALVQAQAPAKVIPTDIPAMTLRFAAFVPPTGTSPENVKWVLKEITRRSGGKVKIDEYWSESLLKDADLTPGVGAGAADIAYVRSTPTIDKNPCWTTLDLPGQGSDAWAVIQAAYEMFHNDPRIRAEFDKQNLVPTWGYFSGNMFFETKKPVNTLKDLKGLRIRSYGGAQSTYLKAAGMVPVFVSLADIYDGINKGVIDGAATPWQFCYSMKYYEVAPYIMKAKKTCAAVAVTNIINKDRWNSFPQSLRKIIDDVSREFNNRFAKAIIEEEDSIEKKLIAENKVKVQEFNPEIQAILFEGAKKAQEEWFAKYDARGIPTRDVWNKFQALVNKYEAEVAAKGYPWKR